MAAKILLVEDDNNLREIYEARLQAEGYIIATAKDGEEALVVAKAEKPDLVISDVMMPRISGFEMLDILRNTEDLKDTKVIMLTALGQADDKTRANSLGADRYLVKSQVTLEDIVKAAHELIGDSASAPAPAAAMPAATMPPTGMAPTMPAPTMAPAAPFAPTPRPAPTMPSATPAPSLSTMMGAQQPMPEPARPVSSEPAFATPTMPPAPAATTPPTMPVDPAPAMAAPAAPLFTPAPQPPMPPLPPMGAAPTMPATADPASSAPLDSPTTAEEQATVDSQINTFAQSPAAPAMVADNSDASKATQDDAVLASAMNDLAASADKPEAEASTPTPAPAPQPTPEPVVAPTESAPQNQTDTTHGSVPIANKKIISPINSEPKQSIHDLLAKEEAKDSMAAGFNQAAAVVSPEPSNTPAMPPMPPAAPTPQAGNVFGPTNPAVPQPPAPSSGSADPNNIAL